MEMIRNVPRAWQSHEEPMDETITILAGILAALTLIDHCRHIYIENQQKRVPVFDTMDMLLVILSIAVLLTVAAKLRTSG